MHFNLFIASNTNNYRYGEVERLLKEYRQNQELVRRIGGHYYQIIYPVQLRHHEKMGISTREVSPPKVRNRLRYKRNISTYLTPGQRPRPHDDSGFSRGRTKTPEVRFRVSKKLHATRKLKVSNLPETSEKNLFQRFRHEVCLTHLNKNHHHQRISESHLT
uniref:Uncharacterized protein n=1 Tax=Glossina austeni TaxID=7395 RepID=A0A1A9UUF9_GLOAU